MHEHNIELLKKEAQRLVKSEASLLKEMLNIEGLLVDINQEQSLSKASAEQAVGVLEDEQRKLENFDMIIAVVGTMKAGKSTTINAIVGSEVLPNRNRPMTALPTLIRHTKGQTTPVLKFENNQPINELILNLEKEIQNQNQFKKIENLCQSDPDMKRLIEFISSKNRYENQYQGSDAIFDFLRGLNDLVRLSREIDIDFPFEKYISMNQFPIIEIEFVHLKETDSNQGRLSLLDTPGPNEAGQPHLRKMMREQLQKASAVLAVLDYTQLKSDADYEVRKELQEIADTSKNRLYAIVNKFDQQDRRGDDEETIKNFISLDLMKEKITNDSIFPVSSKWAYLANRAKHEISLKNNLPDFEKEDWVQDFAEEALGKRWKGKINDREEILQAIEDLWTDSRFELPLKKVIETAHSRAAIFAIDSTAAKLLNFSERMSNLINIRETAIKKDAQELQTQIQHLEKDISEIENSEKKCKTNISQIMISLEQKADAVLRNTKKEAIELIKNYFEEGKRIEKQENQKTKEELRNKSLIRKLLSTNKSHDDFDMNNPIMSFSDRSTALDLKEKINKSVSTVLQNTEEIIIKEMKDALSDFQNRFHQNLQSSTQSIVERMEKRSKEDGFEINISIPSLSGVNFNVSASQMLDDIISEKTETVTRQRRKSGVWGTICKWFDTDDWGWEEYQRKESYYVINIDSVHKKMVSQIDSVFSGMGETISIYVSKPLNKELEDFFDELRKKVEGIRGNLLQSITDKNLNKMKQEALFLELGRLRKSMPAIVKDSKSLKGDIEPLVTQ